MQCPKCTGNMEPVMFQNIEVDRCVACKGLWFDAFEKDQLEKLEGAEQLDIGDAALGRELNKKERYLCPKCSGVMSQMVDPKQSHIWFEQCSSCSGTFFDAGEFKDLKEHSVVDILKSLTTPERS